METDSAVPERLAENTPLEKQRDYEVKIFAWNEEARYCVSMDGVSVFGGFRPATSLARYTIRLMERLLISHEWLEAEPFLLRNESDPSDALVLNWEELKSLAEMDDR